MWFVSFMNMFDFSDWVDQIRENQLLPATLSGWQLNSMKAKALSAWWIWTRIPFIWRLQYLQSRCWFAFSNAICTSSLLFGMTILKWLSYLRRVLTLVTTCSCFMFCFTRVLTARADRLLRPNALWVSAWYSWLRHKHGTEKPSCWATYNYKRPKFMIFVPETLPSFGCSYPGEFPNHCRLMNYDRYNLPRIYSQFLPDRIF